MSQVSGQILLNKIYAFGTVYLFHYALVLILHHLSSFNISFIPLCISNCFQVQDSRLQENFHFPVSLFYNTVAQYNNSNTMASVSSRGEPHSASTIRDQRRIGIAADDSIHSHTVRKTCAALFRKNQFVDVTLSCTDGQLQAHRVSQIHNPIFLSLYTIT